MKVLVGSHDVSLYNLAREGHLVFVELYLGRVCVIVCACARSVGFMLESVVI